MLAAGSLYGAASFKVEKAHFAAWKKGPDSENRPHEVESRPLFFLVGNSEGHDCIFQAKIMEFSSGFLTPNMTGRRFHRTMEIVQCPGRPVILGMEFWGDGKGGGG